MNSTGNYTGYKINGGHFKLGSKIHVQNFYYAKHLFQNSFYSGRFAYLIAKDILARNLLVDAANVTVIGYGLYSELLVNRLKTVLSFTYKDKKINYNLVSDTENLEYINNNRIYENVVIVIPIATTFSTSVKIEKYIREKSHNAITVHQPFYNVLVVGDNNIESASRLDLFLDDKERRDVLKKFQWVEIRQDTREITINALNLENQPVPKRQKYFLSLESKWHAIEECPLCFPSNLADEKLLIETDPVSVTPNLIFELPIIEKFKAPLNHKINFNTDSLQYGHSGYSNKCFLYKIRREVFFEDNKDRIYDWLVGLTKKIVEQKVVLISPGHYTNSSFLDFVNNTVFKGTATVIHYNPQEDFVNNFLTFYEAEIMNAEGIYFVDDVLASGEVFNSLNTFVEQLREKRPASSRIFAGFKGHFVMIDRSDYFTGKSIERRIGAAGGFYVFHKYHVPPVKISHLGCPLCLQYEYYGELIDFTLLDSVKLFLDAKRLRIRKKDLFKKDELYSTDDFDPFLPERETLVDMVQMNRFNIRAENKRFNKNVFKFLVTDEMHILMSEDSMRAEIAAEHNSVSATSLRERIFLKLRNCEAIVPYFVGNNTDNEIKVKEKILHTALLKVLTSSPFIYYKNLRELAFEWVKKDLISFIESENSINLSFKFDNIRELKLLIRRSVTLRSNIIISLHFLLFLKKMFDAGAEKVDQFIAKITERVRQTKRRSLEDGANSRYYAQVIVNLEYKKKRITEFNYFLLALVKELIHNNEAKSIHLEKNLNYKSFIIDCEGSQSTDLERDDFYYLWRLLKLENIGTLKQFLNYHIVLANKDASYEPLFSEPATKGQVEKWIIDKYFTDNVEYKVEPLVHFLKTSPNYADHKAAFIKTLEMIDFLRYAQENRSGRAGLEQNLETVGGFLLDVLGLDRKSAKVIMSIEFRYGRSPEDVESVFTYTGKKDNPQLDGKGFIYEMLNGMSQYQAGYPHTFIELVKKGKTDYRGLRRNYYRSGSSRLRDNMNDYQLDISECMAKDIQKEIFDKKQTQFLFYRLATMKTTDKQLMKDEGQAVISIASQGQCFHDPERIRLLLLAKDYLVDFLELHFMNDSFIEVLEDKAKMSTMKTLQHGVNRYILAMSDRIEAFSDADENKMPLKLYTDFLSHQVANYTKYPGKEMLVKEEKTVGEIKEQLMAQHKYIFEDKYLALKARSFENIDLELIGDDKIIFNMNNFILWQVFPELIINIKKANTGVLDSGRVKVQWLFQPGSITVTNTLDEVTLYKMTNFPFLPKANGGIEMCNVLLKRSGISPMATHFRDRWFIVKIDFNNQYEKNSGN